MINLYDIAYGAGLGLSAPYWLLKPSARRKVAKALRERMGHVALRDPSGPAILIHAVSLGEINATSELVKLLKSARPDLQIVVSTTTETGYARGEQLYGPDSGVTLIRFPLDFTSAVARVLDAIRPSVVALMEGELWPNFLLQCDRRHIPVVLINGRMTLPAYKRYKLAKLVSAAMFRRIAAACAQNEDYSTMFRNLGAPPDRVRVTGTMKFDTAQVGDHVSGDHVLAREVGLLDQTDPIWICGSTGPGEEAMLLRVHRSLLAEFPKLRIAIVPRKPERFDEVADLIRSAGFSLFRRSRPVDPVPADRPVILGDTMGELRKFYSLAQVVFVGRSLVDLGPRQHGSDMIEPAALAKPVAVGPWTHNFADAMRALKAAQAVEEISDESELEKIIRKWLNDPAGAAEMGRRAQKVVVKNQGATARHAEIILTQLGNA